MKILTTIKFDGNFFKYGVRKFYRKELREELRILENKAT